MAFIAALVHFPSFHILPDSRLARHSSESTDYSNLPRDPLYAKAYKKILLNKSATACLVGTVLVWIFNTVPTYAVSFYRIVFSVSPTVGGAFGAVAAAGGMIGGVAGGKLVNRYGRKTLTVFAGFAAREFRPFCSRSYLAYGSPWDCGLFQLQQ